MRWDAGRHRARPEAGKEFPPKVQKFISPPHSTPSCLPSLTNLCPFRPGCLHCLINHSRATTPPHTPAPPPSPLTSLGTGPLSAPLSQARYPSLLLPGPFFFQLLPGQPLTQTLCFASPYLTALNCSPLVFHSFVCPPRHGGCLSSVLGNRPGRRYQSTTGVRPTLYLYRAINKQRGVPGFPKKNLNVPPPSPSHPLGS